MAENSGLMLALVCAFPVVWAGLWFWLGRWSKGIRLTRVENTQFIRSDEAQKPQPAPGAIRRVSTGGK